MARVRMTHPGLDQQIEVDEVSVPHYRASGWQIAPEPKTTTRAAVKSRRQTTKKGEG